MSREQLTAASDHLESAAADATSDDARDRLTELAGQLDSLASRAQKPDHGRLARIESALDEIQAGENDAVAATIEDALDDIHAFRETLEGV
jgi:hypothetical protein